MQESLSVNRWSRRELLRVGGLGAVGLSLPRLLAAADKPATGPAPKADACIIIFLNGGPTENPSMSRSTTKVATPCWSAGSPRSTLA